jgi:hypothetical protein
LSGGGIEKVADEGSVKVVLENARRIMDGPGGCGRRGYIYFVSMVMPG